MLARRVIALSGDKAFAKVLGTSLRAAGGAVEVHPTIDALGRGDIQASLIVVHLDGELADAIAPLAARLTGDGRLIAVIPRPDLERAIAVMNTSDKVAGVLVAEHFRGADLASMATRVLAGDIFGLEKIVPWGTKIYSQLVGDYQEKSLCIAQISEFAELMGVRRKYREAIEQVVDEMLMNALYDAPVDDQGKQIFAEIPTKTRISLRMEQKVVVQYACDERTFSVSVRDSFGTLDRGTLVRYIDKCLHSDQQIDRKTGGAGLGLYLMANSSTRMFFNVLPGVATEAVCSFDMDTPKVQLQKLGFFHERIDAAGRLVAGPSRLLPQGVSHPVERRTGSRAPVPPRTPIGLLVGLISAIALLLVLIGLVAYPRLQAAPEGGLRVVTTPGATVELDGKVKGVATDGTLEIGDLEAGRSYAVTAHREGHVTARALAAAGKQPQEVELMLVAERATVRLSSDPPGAKVIDVSGGGERELGSTPLAVSELPPGSKVTLLLRRAGYADERVELTTPGPGGEIDIGRELSVSPDIASVLVRSEPPGATVFIDGIRHVEGTAPTREILVEAGKPHVVRFELAGHMPVDVKVTPGRGERSVPVVGKLARAVSVTVTSNVEGRVSIDDLAGCERKATPATCVAARGRYEVRLETSKLPGKISRVVEVGEQDVAVDFAVGVVEAPEGAKILHQRKPVTKAAYEKGKRLITLELADGSTVKVEVRVDDKKPVVAELP